MKVPINGMKVHSKRSQVHSRHTKVHAKRMKVHECVSWAQESQYLGMAPVAVLVARYEELFGEQSRPASALARAASPGGLQANLRWLGATGALARLAIAGSHHHLGCRDGSVLATYPGNFARMPKSKRLSSGFCF